MKIDLPPPTAAFNSTGKWLGVLQMEELGDKNIVLQNAYVIDPDENENN